MPGSASGTMLGEPEPGHEPRDLVDAPPAAR